MSKIVYIYHKLLYATKHNNTTESMQTQSSGELATVSQS